jgi:methylmalonyl-CoA/ethylmalonyl-CoA epimerase
MSRSGAAPPTADRPDDGAPAAFAPPGPIHHVGVVVADLDAAAAAYRALGFSGGERARLPEQNVEIAAFRAGASWIEVLAPLDPDSPIGRFLESRGQGVHHVAYLVDDLPATLAALAAAGIELIDNQPRAGLHGWRIAFVHPRSCAGVLTELVERSSVTRDV